MLMGVRWKTQEEPGRLRIKVEVLHLCNACAHRLSRVQLQSTTLEIGRTCIKKTLVCSPDWD
jgi:hypothetical protein